MARAILWLLPLVFTATASADYAVNYANADPSRWRCRLCEFDKAQAPSGEIVVGSMDSAYGEARFGRDTGIDQAGQYLDLNANWQAKSESGTVWRFAGSDLGLASRVATLAASRAKRYGVDVRLAQLPRRIATDGRFPFRRVADTLALSSDWRRGFGSAETTPLETERRRGALRAWIATTPHSRIHVGYSQERKTGVAETYRDAFYQAAALPQSIDQRTQEVLLGWRYSAARALLDASFERRTFANSEAALVWQNPYYGPATRRSASAPDNATDLLRLVAKFQLGARTTLRATLADGETSQDAPFLPYTTNSRLDVPLPADGLNGHRQSRYGRVVLLTQLAPRLRLTVSHTADHRTDRRIAAVFAPVLGDLLTSAAQTVRGFSFERRQTAVRLRYRTPRRLRWSAGFVRRDAMRSNLEIGRNRERGVYLEASRLFGDWQLSAKRSLARRGAGDFVVNTANNPLTRRYYQAHRIETVWQGSLRYRRDAFAAGLQTHSRRHDYPDSALGLQHAAMRGWNVDFAYALGHASASASYGVDRRRSTTNGRAASEWRYDTRDTVATAAARLDFRVPQWRIDVTLDGVLSDGLGAYATMFEAALSHFPDLVSRHRSFDLRVRHRLKNGVAVVAGIYLERYRARDWAIDGIAPTNIPNVLAAGRSSPLYANRLLYLSFEKPL